jgi:predicted deacylase
MLTLLAVAFSVGTASAQPGQKTHGTIEVPAGVDAALSIPVVVANGVKPGPVLALVSGAHGTEYASIIALEKVIERLDPATLSGTVIVVPLININSFEKKVPHVNPIDNKSMNRFYPGKADGTQTERASLAMTKQVVEQADYLIDLHGGDLDESLRPYTYWPKTGNADFDAKTKAMALAFGIDNIIIDTSRPHDPNASRYLDNTALTRGKPAIAAEAGYAGTTETDDVELLVNGCMNVMRYLKMLPGTATMVENPVWFESVQTVASDVNGIFYPNPNVKRGTYVQQGQLLGRITDYTGQLLVEPKATASGVILYVDAVPTITKGGTVANIGVVAK